MKAITDLRELRTKKIWRAALGENDRELYICLATGEVLMVEIEIDDDDVPNLHLCNYVNERDLYDVGLMSEKDYVAYLEGVMEQAREAEEERLKWVDYFNGGKLS